MTLVVVPVYWIGQDGYLVDNNNNQRVSPEESESPLSYQDGSKTSRHFKISPDSQSQDALNFEGVLAEESDMSPDQYSLVLPTTMEYDT